MTDPTAPMFDTSLSIFADSVTKILGVGALTDGVFVRDGTGRLSFVAPTDAPSEQERTTAANAIRKTLGAYARPDRVLVYADDPGAHRLLSDVGQLPIQVGSHFCRLVDRRIVGSGWLEKPFEETSSPPRIVFSSIKGGVGRSTALAVAASDLASRGRNVLVIDLDLEAPGLGDLLLKDGDKPLYGTLDFMVENGIGGISDTALSNFVGSSALTSPLGGRVDVVPAFGETSRDYPENVLPKLSRALLDDVTAEGDNMAVAEQLAVMISRLTSRSQYDVVLIDSRAGLAEISAPAILGLGATVLLFGTAQKQTLEGYRALFAALRLLAQRDLSLGSSAGWRQNLKAVYAKSSFNEQVVGRHRADLYDLFSEYIYDADGDDLESQGFSFSMDDIEAPHWPLSIPFSSNFVDFDPVRDLDQLNRHFYEQTFRPFMEALDSIINDAQEISPKDSDT